MEIYGTPTSPYTRIARIIAAELGFQPPLRMMKWRETPDDLYKINPAGRIPLLVDGDRSVGESRTICNYLIGHPQAHPEASFRKLEGDTRWDEENLLGMIYAAIDGLVVIRALDDPPAVSHPYKERSRERIEQCFRAIDDIAAQGYLVEPNGFGIAEAALITAIDAIGGRGIADLSGYVHTNSIRTRYADRTSVAETAPVF